MIAEVNPVHFWIGHQVGIEVAGRATEFGRKGDVGHQFVLLGQSIDKDEDLFSKTRRRGGLSMGAGQHGDFFPCQRLFGQIGRNGLKSGRYVLMPTLLQCQRHGGIVDIL